MGEGGIDQEFKKCLAKKTRGSNLDIGQTGTNRGLCMNGGENA